MKRMILVVLMVVCGCSHTITVRLIPPEKPAQLDLDIIWQDSLYRLEPVTNPDYFRLLNWLADRGSTEAFKFRHNAKKIWVIFNAESSYIVSREGEPVLSGNFVDTVELRTKRGNFYIFKYSDGKWKLK